VAHDLLHVDADRGVEHQGAVDRVDEAGVLLPDPPQRGTEISLGVVLVAFGPQLAGHQRTVAPALDGQKRAEPLDGPRGTHRHPVTTKFPPVDENHGPRRCGLLP
jgi:hypothetical protein